MLNDIDPDSRVWLWATLGGVVVGTIRRFRKDPNESLKVILWRLIGHTSTCVLAGYVVYGLLLYYEIEKLIPPACALAGMFGSMLADVIEEIGKDLIKKYLRNKI